MEVGLRLHFLPRIELPEFTYLLHEFKIIWDKLEGQSSETDLQTGIRSKKKEPVLPIPSDKAKSRSSLALVSKRRRAERMLPILKVKKQNIVMPQPQDAI